MFFESYLNSILLEIKFHYGRMKLQQVWCSICPPVSQNRVLGLFQVEGFTSAFSIFFVSLSEYSTRALNEATGCGGFWSIV